MIPALLRLPTTSLASDGFDAVCDLVVRLSAERLVLIGSPKSAAGNDLDEFTIAAALVAHDPRVRLGVASSVGTGRAPSMLAREATTAQLLGACDVLLLEGDAASCRDAATIVGALFTPGTHTMTTRTASIDRAVNDPVPSGLGGPPVLWRVAGALHRLVEGDDTVVGDVHDVSLPAVLPAPVAGSLVVAHHEVVAADDLGAAFVA
jgi:hypothetical protein